MRSTLLQETGQFRANGHFCFTHFCKTDA
uniref:Uncharacterized protein n=1 Tax=Anguilla anguilla TaxID=7936 RepID=A0A0E9TCA8_ANGAN